MRKNYFAKKLIAYSMAFAVAFSTLTVSPVFVKEAKAAAGTVTLPAGTDATANDGKVIVNTINTVNAATVNGACPIKFVSALASFTNIGLTVNVLKATANAME